LRYFLRLGDMNYYNLESSNLGKFNYCSYARVYDFTKPEVEFCKWDFEKFTGIKLKERTARQVKIKKLKNGFTFKLIGKVLK